MIRAASVSYVVGGRALVDDVAFDLPGGTLTALVGPNGAGKSTMLGLLSGDLEASAGTVHLGDRPVAEWKVKDLARQRGVMLQQQAAHFGFSVEETVEMGRLPHDVDPGRDREIVESALRGSDLAALRRRDVTTLSGGEGARTAYARVVAQTTPVVLLDEPTAALDLRAQEALLRSARAKADEGAAVVVVLHDLNQAARYADRVLMFSGGRLVADGPPPEVLTPPRIEEVYGQRVHLMEHPETGAPVLVPAHG
ncbi:heme ABC transporter ATP-binding protein [Rothia sp. AR01]|uniref:Heme ABC transporter ATP-binding protein n=1 Tax=Rothia santali TaxID=2949643 RepID=A0A9X2HAI8_9MICC|nr:heme ABC transporter ATP-binding protein [Rothia santali]MCP3424550.1 heme ABC transporter ATP-binding protein [Rothia santali]